MAHAQQTEAGGTQRLEEGDVIKVVEAHNGHLLDALLVIAIVVRADDPSNEQGEEYSVANGPSGHVDIVLTSKVERVHTKAEYAQAYPTWEAATEQIKSALSGMDDVVEVEVKTLATHPDPDGHAGLTDLDLYFRRDDGHSVGVSIQLFGRVLALDERFR